MCTIGSLYDGQSMVTFKQCDLVNKTNFFKPVINSKGSIKYMVFGREGSQGAWAGINNFGVSVVAADAYLTRANGLNANVGSGVSIFEAYQKIISDFTDAKSAAEYMVQFYNENNIEADILLIADVKERYYIETCRHSKEKVICVPLTNTVNPNYFASTNHFTYLHGMATYPENHSSYLRLKRAETILENDTSFSGVTKVLKDQHYGKSVLSICREKEVCPSGEEAYFTQACAIFRVDSNGIKCSYQINGNLQTNSLVDITFD